MARSLSENFLAFIREKSLVRKGGKVLLTVSGGLDSTTMAHLFAGSGIPFGIAHCNFSLRGKESDGDQLFVEKLAKKLNVEFHTVQFRTKEFAKKNKLSVQEAARNLRYEWFEKIRHDFHYDVIATAHHRDDSTETFFINLIRGTGTAGLKGIPVKNGKIIRPLLFSGRTEIESWAKKKKIKFREDSSNADDAYLRNSIRHHLLPYFKANETKFDEKIQDAMGYFEFIDGFIRKNLNEWKKNNVRRLNDHNEAIPLNKLRKQESPDRFLSLLLHSYGITNLDSHRILAAQSAGKVFHSGKFRLLFDRDELILQTGKEYESDTLEIDLIPTEFRRGGKSYILQFLNAERLDHIPRETNIHAVDAGKLTFPLTVRKWQPGDSFHPFGMKGRKKVSDFLIDRKVNKFDKEMTLVLLSGQNIVCILGHRIDDRFKITSDTHSVLKIEICDEHRADTDI